MDEKSHTTVRAQCLAHLHDLAQGPLPQMKAECRAHLMTAKWCYDQGCDEWGNIEYYAYLDCLKR